MVSALLLYESNMKALLSFLRFLFDFGAKDFKWEKEWEEKK